MLNELLNHEQWLFFLSKKQDNEFLNDHLKKEFEDFIVNKKYLTICESIVNNTYEFSIPIKKELSKKYTDKKRIVYNYRYDEMLILKYISFLLNKYDYLFSTNLYSFRTNKSVNEAINILKRKRSLKYKYGYKIDISNYFNSINVPMLLNDLKDKVDNDIYNLFSLILNNKKVMYKGQIIEEEKGGMAGLPISGFFANFFLRQLDEYFKEKKIIYFRYSDDIIIFTNSIDERESCVNYINNFLKEKLLKTNPKKVYYIEPFNEFEFLGFKFNNNIIDISNNTVSKIKRSIHHKAKMLLKWADKKKVDYSKTLPIMIKKYNIKFFGKEENEISWKYWFFPFINTTESLKIVDNYLQDTLRYMISGKHNKKNYNKCNYNDLKNMGYKSLVNEFYKFKRDKA